MNYAFGVLDVMLINPFVIAHSLVLDVGWAKNEATPTPYIGVNLQPR